MENAFFFENNGLKLYGFLHLAKPVKGTEGLAYVFCSPFVEEKVRTQRTFVNFARMLAQKGISVLRFDYGGYGDSEGNFEDATISSQKSDIRKAIDILQDRTNCSKIGLLGGRLGATLAFMVGCEESIVEDIVLWDPVIDVHQYLLKYLRSNLASQTLKYKKIIHNRNKLECMILEGKNVDIEGYLLSKDFYSEAMNINLISNNFKYSGKCLIVEVVKRELDKKTPLTLLKQEIDKSGTCELSSITDNYSWEAQKKYNPQPSELFSVTYNWIKG
jgi:exosortase A-associated hydrolase 2